MVLTFAPHSKLQEPRQNLIQNLELSRFYLSTLWRYFQLCQIIKQRFKCRLQPILVTLKTLLKFKSRWRIHASRFKYHRDRKMLSLLSQIWVFTWSIAQMPWLFHGAWKTFYHKTTLSLLTAVTMKFSSMMQIMGLQLIKVYLKMSDLKMTRNLSQFFLPQIAQESEFSISNML